MTGLPRAAVAAVLKGDTNGLQLLMIRRAEQPGDPWSGHMAFPGGRVDADDQDPQAAAVREAHEELGLKLTAHASFVGRLSPVLTPARLKPPGLVIHPFVYLLETETEFVLQTSEVAEALWIPWSLFNDPDARSSFKRPLAKVPLSFPCYRYGDRIIWGLTLRMIDELRTRLSEAKLGFAC